MSYIDFKAEFAVEDSTADYTVKSYIKFADGTVVYSTERTDLQIMLQKDLVFAKQTILLKMRF